MTIDANTQIEAKKRSHFNHTELNIINNFVSGENVEKSLTI